MPSVREFWQSGFRALHIEENISNAFADFAPYAGADEQRIVVTRQSSSTPCSPPSAVPTTSVGTPLGPASYVGSSSTVIMEENGDFAVQARDAAAGCITFSTTGHLQLDAAVRVPLPLPSLHLNRTEETAHLASKVGDGSAGTVVKQSKEVSDPPLQERQEQREVFHLPVKPSPSQTRFSDYTRPVMPPSPYHTYSPAEETDATAAPPPEGTKAGSFGQLEMDASLPDWNSNRQSLGARVGPAAARLTRTFSAAASATAAEAAAAQLQNSGSLSDEDELARTARAERSRRYQYTVDAALCVPFGGGGGDNDDNGDAGTNSGKSGTNVTRTLRGDRIALRTAPWALTCGVQFPLDIGDTLVGVSLQNDRATTVSLPSPGVEWAVSAASPTLPPTQHAADERADAESVRGSKGEENAAAAASSVACVPSPFYSRHAAPLPSYVVVPYFTLRFLLVQTLASHTLVRETSPAVSPDRDDSGSTSLNTSGATRLASSYDWRRLPTLVGVNVGIDRERLRLSAASIVHDGDMDLEVAAVLDVTPWTPRMPTLVKVGYNNVGRFAAGITSLFYETVSATLGVHVARGEQAKFGIEVKF